MAKVWMKATEIVESASVDTGDILYPLRKVQVKYNIRALRHEASGHPERAEYYHEQVANVGRLINQES